MRVLVTGASGLIGRHAANELARSGHEVVLVVRNGQEADVKRIFRVDLAEAPAMKRLLQAEFDSIVHCAAVMPGVDAQTAEVAAAANSLIDAAVLGAAKERAVPLIYLSSVSTYGAARRPWWEHTPPMPQSAYAAGKLAAENAFLAGLNHAVALRISSPYGPGQRVRNVLRLFVEKALAGEAISYHGSGARTQDFVAAQDVASAIRLALESDAMCEVINIASGAPISMRALAELVAEAAGNAKTKITPSGETDPQENYRADVSIEKAKALLGWKPMLPLAQGIKILANSMSVRSC